eukprot:9360427-Alexandrium_andersonii.AAC.1
MQASERARAAWERKSALPSKREREREGEEAGRQAACQQRGTSDPTRGAEPTGAQRGAWVAKQP